MMEPSWECNQQTSECCFINDATCSQGDISNYVMAAESPEDVAEAIKFATDKNILITVRSTGHDY